MKYCKKCNVSVRDDSRICPLCQHKLAADDDAKPVFPYIPIHCSNKEFYIKLSVFAIAVICVISVILDLVITSEISWSIYVLGGAVSLLIILAVSLPKLKNIPKIILHQAVTCAVLAYIWDRCTGGYGWSVDYVIPFLCAGTNVALIAVFFALRLRIDDVAFYYFVNLVYGLLPIWFILGEKIKVMYPSLVSVGVSVTSLAAFVLFYGPNLLTMLKSKFHI